MKRPTSTRVKATATLALACTTALVFAVATVQARPTHTAGPQAATAALSDCTIVITAAPWRYLKPGRQQVHAQSAGHLLFRSRRVKPLTFVGSLRRPPCRQPLLNRRPESDMK
jgi:hypothetical protein